jgi:Tfp pilus assembly protein PilX
MKYQKKDSQQAMLLMLVRLQRYRLQDEGYAMVVVIVMLLILASLLTAFMLLSKTETASTKATSSGNTGYYAAEAGLNLRAKQVQDKFQGFNRPSGTSPGTSPNAWQNCLDANTANDGSGDFACSIQTFNGQRLVTYVVDQTAGSPISLIIPNGELYAGLSAQEYRYDVTSVALDSQNLPTAILGMRFKSRVVPMFQFVAFYQDDLDFAVPPTMTLNGPIHSNNDLYFDASTTLTVNGQVSTAGTLYRGNKIANNCNGTVNIFNPSTATALGCGSSSTRRSYSQSNVSAWNDMIRVGVAPLTIPAPGDFDPAPGKLYWEKADLRIVLKLDSSGNPWAVEIRDRDNTVNTTASTNLWNSCPTTNTTLEDEAAGDSNYELDDTVLKVASATGFNVGDVINIGTDYDSNVISAVNTTSTPNTITLKRQLGHSYQASPIASTGNAVRKAVVSTSDTFYNYREKNGGSGVDAGRYIRMLNVDVQGLLDCAYSQNLMGKTLDDDTDGGLVWFLNVDGPNSNTNVRSASAPNTPNNYGVRLYNGKYLYSKQSGAPEIKGLTVVSDQAVYIRGDYNLKDDSTTSGTNEGDDPATTSVTERWRPAAILADTINVLSNAWNMDDSNGRDYSSNLPSTTVLLTSSVRAASATTFNTAFLANNDISGGVNGVSGQGGGWSSSGGGLNNYPRFHENWGGIAMNYRGSFVTLGQSRRVNGPWCGSQSINASCNIYAPPNRFWSFETDFNNAANLPPVTPRFVYLRQENFTRNFDR